MKLNGHRPAAPTRGRWRSVSAFSLTEVMVASAIVATLLGGFMTFTDFTMRGFAGITRQSTLNQKSGHAADFVLSRVRLANFITNDATGKTLYLGFDDNLAADTDADGNPYNDRDHYEMFQFDNGDGTNSTTGDNRLIYRPNTNTSLVQVLIPDGLRLISTSNVFSVANRTLVYVNFGAMDNFSSDGYQIVEVRTKGVCRNSP